MEQSARRSLRRGQPALGSVLEFMQDLWTVVHDLQVVSKRMRTVHRVTGAQRLVIRIVGRLRRCSAKDVAEILRLHPSTLTVILDRLERDALIDRRWDPRDARRASLTLTPRGRRVNALKRGTVEAAVRKALARLTGREVATFRRGLALLAEELERLPARQDGRQI